MRRIFGDDDAIENEAILLGTRELAKGKRHANRNAGNLSNAPINRYQECRIAMSGSSGQARRERLCYIVNVAPY